MTAPAGQPSRIAHLAGWVLQFLISAAAVYFAIRMAETDLFQQLSSVVADHISRGLGQPEASHVVLLRVPNEEHDLAELLYNAIQTLASSYQPAALGVDIDLSKGGFGGHAKDLYKLPASSPLAKKLVWAVGDIPGPGAANSPLSEAEQGLCDECDGPSCQIRFARNWVFGRPDLEPTNYGLAIVFPNPSDPYDVNRWSARFFCGANSDARLTTFHFKLVEVYCATHPGIATCKHLEPNLQSATKIRSWYRLKPIQLCELLTCNGTAVQPKASNGSSIDGKIVILYRDIPGNDEHLTFMGLQKGGVIVASLIENELNYGVSPYWRTPLMKWSVEIALAVVLLALFHWRLAKYLAVPGAVAIFLGYLWLVPKLVTLVPDFREYVLAIILAFLLEMYLKLVWISYKSGS